MRYAQRPCPLCGNRDTKILTDLEFGDFDGTSLDRRVVVVSCEYCGLVYNDSAISKLSLEDYYRNEALYAAEMGVGSGGTSLWDMRRYDSTLETLRPFIPAKDARIIDVGCAKGGFLSLLQGLGYSNIRGVDINPFCVEFVQQRFGLMAETGRVDNLPLQDNQADLLVYSHVIEHVYDLIGALVEARRVLRDGGLLFIELPDAARYTDYPVSDYYWFSQKEHVNHFDLFHLKQLVQSAGFELLDEGRMLISIATQIDNPLIYAIFRKINTFQAICPIQFHDDLRNSIQNYVYAENQRLETHRSKVITLITRDLPIYIWGIGLEFFTLYVQAELKNCNLKALVDRNPHKRKRTVDGRPIISPDRLRHAPPHSGVVITSALHKKNMQTYLADINFAGEVIILT